MTSVRICKIAAGAERDAGGSKATRSIARIGCPGSSTKNTARNLDRHIRRSGLLGDVEPYPVTLIGKKSSGFLLELQVLVILPHELCSMLFGCGAMWRLCGDPGDLANFWKHVSGDLWFQDHPHQEAILADPNHSIPFRLWGDGACVNTTRSLYCLTFSSVVCLRLASMLSRFLITAVPDGTYVDLEPLWIVIAWSFEVLVAGTMPLCGHDCTAFDPKSIRA